MKTKRLLTVIAASFFLVTTPLIASSLDQIIITDKAGMVYNLTEEQVLNQLMCLAGKGVNEDGWYFIPETGELIDCGRETMPSTYSPDWSVILDKQKKPERIIGYHIHPNHGEEYLKGAHPPSLNDIIYWLDEFLAFKDLNIDVKEFRVVEAEGYWSVNLHYSNLKELKKEDFNAEYKKAHMDYLARYVDIYFKNKKNGTSQQVLHSIQNWLIQTFERDARKLGLDIEYHKL